MPPRLADRASRAMRAAAVTAALASAVLGSACAGPAKDAWGDVRPPEAFVEVLPRDAELWVDGVAAGRGSRAVPVPDRDHLYAFRAAAPGFAPAERAAEGARLAGARLGIVLRPEAFGTARRLEIDEPTGLAAAGAALLRAGRPAQAAEYEARAAELAPDEPAPHRLLAEAYRALGDGARAAREYDAYLRLAPDAPDRAEVERAIEASRKDVTMPEKP